MARGAGSVGEPTGSPAGAGALIDGADRAAVREAVAEIADALEAQPRGYSFGPGHDLALADGEAGIAVLLAACPGHRDAAERRVARAIEGLSGGVALDASLHLGFTGIAWAWEHVMGRDEDDPLDAVDQALLAALRTPSARFPPGLLFGLAGMAIYALERSTPTGDACLEAIVERLSACAEVTPHGGWRWRLASPPGTDYVARFPDGFYDLGLDVGAAGIAAVCAQIAARGVAAAPARALAAQAARGIVEHATPRGTPSKLGPTGDAVYGAGWCKGELGMAIALVEVARVTGDSALAAHAHALGAQAAERAPERCEEPGFHVGAAGALHGFHQLYRATGAPVFRDAALRWLARLLALRRPGAGIAGFTTAAGDVRQGLAQGAAGIGLALLAATEAAPPRWDRVLGGSAGVA